MEAGHTDAMDNKKATLELGTKPVGGLLLQYATPAIIAMVASSLYNIIDSVFIGQGVGALAIAGLAITFPFMNLSGAFGASVGVGSATYMSMKLGMKDYDTAQKVLGNNIVMNIIIGLVFGALGLVFLEPILRFFGASDATMPYAYDYMQVILLGNVFTHLYFGLNAVLRSASKPREAMIATVLSVVLNIILAPIFIYVMHWGIRGAALATVLAQIISLAWQIKLFSNQNELIHMQRGIYKLRSNIVKNILAIGISPFAMNACTCVVVIFVNTSLVRYGGDMGVGAYGIANRIATVFAMIVIGINQGMQPIAGYNYGAEKYDRLMEVLKLSVVYATVIMTAGWALGEFFPYHCARLFTTDAELIGMSIRAIRINMILFPIIGFQMVATNFFQSIGKAKISIFLSLSRQLIFLLPLLIVLPLFFGYDGVWYSLPASDAIASVLTFFLLVYYIKKFKTTKP